MMPHAIICEYDIRLVILIARKDKMQLLQYWIRTDWFSQLDLANRLCLLARGRSLIPTTCTVFSEIWPHQMYISTLRIIYRWNRLVTRIWVVWPSTRKIVLHENCYIHWCQTWSSVLRFWSLQCREILPFDYFQHLSCGCLKFCSCSLWSAAPPVSETFLEEALYKEMTIAAQDFEFGLKHRRWTIWCEQVNTLIQMTREPWLMA